MVQDRLDIGAIEMPAALANTGSASLGWVPIVGGFVLLVGIGFVGFSRLGRRATGRRGAGA